MSQPAVVTVTSRAPGVARAYFWAAGLSAASALVDFSLRAGGADHPVFGLLVDVAFAAALAVQGRWWQEVGRVQAGPERAEPQPCPALDLWTGRTGTSWGVTAALALVSGAFGLARPHQRQGEYAAFLLALLVLAALLWWSTAGWLRDAARALTQPQEARSSVHARLARAMLWLFIVLLSLTEVNYLVQLLHSQERAGGAGALHLLSLSLDLLGAAVIVVALSSHRQTLSLLLKGSGVGRARNTLNTDLWR